LQEIEELNRTLKKQFIRQIRSNYTEIFIRWRVINVVICIAAPQTEKQISRTKHKIVRPRYAISS
jgi:hypothetical protein